MSDQVIMYVLDCGHVQPGKPNQIMTDCYSCGEQKRTIDVHAWEWHMVCRTCNKGKWTGLSKELANFHANQHVMRNPAHQANVLYQQNPTALKVGERMDKIHWNVVKKK